MTDEQIALARRAIACKGWRWKEGMCAFYGGRRSRVCRDLTGELYLPIGPGPRWQQECLPDLWDDATKGCVVGLLRAAWRCPTAHVRQSTGRRASDNQFAWEVCDLWLDAEACKKLGTSREGSVNCWGLGSEEEALVVGLESAP